MHGNPRGRNEELLQMAVQARRRKEAKRWTISVKPRGVVKLSLRAAKFLPARVFTVQNQLDMDVTIVVDGREIRLEKT